MGRTNLDIAIAKLKQEIKACEKYKKRLSQHVQKLKDKCINKKISYYEYETFINKKLDNKTIKQWIIHYNSHIQTCEKKIKKLEKRFKIKKTLPIILVSITIISILIMSIFYLRPVIIGLVTKEQTNTYTQELNLQITQSQDYELQLKELGQLKSIELSGLIQGQGEVKVYLEDLLILDSSNIKSKTITKNKITGLIIKEQENLSAIELILGFFQKTFLTITGKATENSEEISESSSESESSKSELSESESSKESASPKSNSEETQEKASQETSPSQKEPLQSSEELKEQEEDVEQPIKEEKELEKPVEQPEEDVKEQTEEEKIEEEQKEEEITEEKEPTTDTDKEQETIIIKEFKNLCEKTCDLQELNLNKTSYTLKIQVSNAELNLNKVKYKIITKKSKEEIKENITGQETPASQENITEPEKNITTTDTNITNITNITIPDTNITPLTNITITNKTITNITQEINIIRQ